MIAVSNQRYLPTLVNTMVLFKDGLYFYLHRDVYDQAVVLTDLFDSTPDVLAERIGGLPENEETMRWFFETAPKPLHILAPCLRLIAGPIERDIEQACGVLHVITSMIHVRSFIDKPEEIRRSVSFSLTIKDEYELAWESFFASAIPYDQRVQLLQGAYGAETLPGPQAAVLDTVSLFPAGSGTSETRKDRASILYGPTEEEKAATRSLLMK